MPLRIPPVLLIRRLAQQCLFAVIFAVRAVVVGIIWLAVLPWATVWTWRMYFTMGDSTYVLVNNDLLVLPDVFQKSVVDK
jgi:E3 ubiquitin-protein ligase MARCH6